MAKKTAATKAVEQADNLMQYVLLLGNVVKLITNPNLPVETGPGSVLGKIGELVTFAQDLLLQGGEADEELTALNTHIQQLVDEDRGPTDAEWAEWEARRAAVDERFNRVRGSLDGQ